MDGNKIAESVAYTVHGSSVVAKDASIKTGGNDNAIAMTSDMHSTADVNVPLASGRVMA
jgi:hypothetical protein